MNVFRRDDLLANRLCLAELLRRRDLTGSAAEVGVWRGDFAHGFFLRWCGKKLYLIDPWRKLDDYDDVRDRDFDPADYDFAAQRFAPLGEAVELVRATSDEAAPRFAASSLDFVYIDANHAYGHVAQDLSLWWPRVRPGGVLAGHDLFSLDHPGVTAAVAEFALARRLVAHVVRGGYDDAGVLVDAHSFYFVKPARG